VTADEFQARRDEILAQYETDLKKVEMTLERFRRGGGALFESLPTVEEARQKRDRALAEVRKDEIEQLELERLRREVRGGVARSENEPQEFPASNDPPGLKRTPGPDPDFHERGTIAAALDELRRTNSVTEAMKVSDLSDKDVLRVEKIAGLQLFRLDGGQLWVQPEKVQQRGRMVALRVLRMDSDGPRWVDPA
jgi:hypothetical protein